jgi:putative methyltransferase (TIGR04325 family)
VTNIVDAGGHMGTKFFAFREMLMLQDRVEWIVYDLPALVRAGRARAEREGVPGLRFIDRLEDAPPSHLFLASGLLQYLDVPFPQLLARLPARPRHMIINKVALREGPTVVTLERHGDARVTYQIRNQNTFMSEISELGYRVVDHWTIPILSHVIPTHPELGASQSKGFCLELTN